MHNIISDLRCVTNVIALHFAILKKACQVSLHSTRQSISSRNISESKSELILLKILVSSAKL